MQKVFFLTNKYIVVATPLILYVLFSNIYMAVTASGGSRLGFILAFCLLFLMTAVFISGWFVMIKSAVSEPEREDSNSLISLFVSGVGDYFLSSLGAILLLSIINIGILMVAYTIGLHIIGDIGISANSIPTIFTDASSIKTFLSSLSVLQLKKLYLWNVYILGVIMLISFTFLLYMPALFFKSKNPLVALWICLKNTFSRYFFKTAGVFLMIVFANFIISLFTALFGSNPIMSFVMTFINFYFLSYVGIGLFYYYYNNFVNPKLGQLVDKTV